MTKRTNQAWLAALAEPGPERQKALADPRSRIHDARQRLRRRMIAELISLDEALAAFEPVSR